MEPPNPTIKLKPVKAMGGGGRGYTKENMQARESTRYNTNAQWHVRQTAQLFELLQHTPPLVLEPPCGILWGACTQTHTQSQGHKNRLYL